MTLFGFRRWPGDLVALAIGLTIAGLQGFLRTRRDRRAETWPVSYGRIDRISVDSDEQRGKLKCYYTYRVGSKSFVGSFQKTFEDSDQAHLWADALQKKQVAVHYDPSKPSGSQLREADLRPIALAAAPSRMTGAQTTPIRGWERLAALGVLILSVLGLAVSVATLIEELTRRTLVSPATALCAGISAYPVFLAATWFHWKRKSAKGRPWMKYLDYALLYCAAFATILPTHSAHHRATDTPYQLVLYFTAFKWCYTFLPETDEIAQNAFSSSSSMPS